MPAELKPDGTLAAGGWQNDVGSSLDLHTGLADDDKLTFVQSPANPNTTFKVSLGPPPAVVPVNGILIVVDAVQYPY